MNQEVEWIPLFTHFSIGLQIARESSSEQGVSKNTNDIKNVSHLTELFKDMREENMLNKVCVEYVGNTVVLPCNIPVTPM